MPNSIDTLPLIALLPLAVERGVIDGWKVEGHNLVFQRGAERLYVHAVAAGNFLAALIGETDRSTSVNGKAKHLTLN